MLLMRRQSEYIFLLTHPVWDVTCSAVMPCKDPLFLLTHPVWDVTNTSILFQTFLGISTHTSRVGCDVATPTEAAPTPAFLLTHPVWDVTTSFILILIARRISTHTSRVGCD